MNRWQTLSTAIMLLSILIIGSTFAQVADECLYPDGTVYCYLFDENLILLRIHSSEYV